jgi:NhaP-type Na+/H+ or K+/H+ antiporter
LNRELLVELASIIFLGAAAQWLSWRLRLPSILLLLVFGFLSGPVLGLVKPDQFFGNMLFPIVSISVAVILFEGGLNLKLSELKSAGGIIRNMVTIGILVTWVLTTFAAFYILNLEFSLSVLLGAILVVTGPTVILPILTHIRPAGSINSILKWEGIVNDPIGALLGILIFEVILTRGVGEATATLVFGILKTILLSVTVGLIGAYVIVFMLKYRLIPDFLQNSISLAVVVGVFSLGNLFQEESGLFSVTIMGVILANQKKVTVKYIIEFKENLRTILISVLFIILAARLNFSDLRLLNFGSALFTISLIILIRPLAVYLSTIHSALSWKEKLYLAWMAPRGVVAASITSIFAIELMKAGHGKSEYLVPLVFLVIIATIIIYGLSAEPLAIKLGISNSNPQGCLILGAHPLGRAIGKALAEKEIKVLMIDSNYNNIRAARMEGLPAFQGSILSEFILEEIDLSGIGKLLAITPNKEVNSLATIYFSKIFGSNEVYQLSVEEDEQTKGKKVSQDLRGRILFGTDFTYNYLVRRFHNDQQLKSTNITEKFDYNSFLQQYSGDVVIPFFVIDQNKNLTIYTNENKPKAEKGNVVIGLFKENIQEES